MKRMDRRTFMLVAVAGGSGAVLVGCGNDPDSVDLNPTMIPVDGAPPTLAPMATPGGGAAEPADTGGGEAAAESGVVTLEAQDPFNWSTNELEAAPGAVIQVTNVGALDHDFVIDELGIAEALPSGEPVEVTLPDDLAVGDTYTYYCSIPGHRESGMEGTLTIVEASAPAEEAAPAEGDAASTPEAEAEGSPAADEPVAEEDLIAVPAEALEMMEDPSVIALEATDPYNWSKKEISAAPGQVIRVLNRGVLEHDFVIDEFDISQVLVFGEPVDIQVPADAEVGSTHEYYCSVPGHRERGMVGVLTIVEGDGGGATPAASPVSTPAAEPAASGGATEVDLKTVDLAFEPSEFTIAANTDVTVTITNDGVLEHDFAVEELGVQSDALQAGSSTTVTINAAPGTYEFHCTVPGHAQAGMVGTLTVQ
jgi:uncharacterized cupredoxin-like copper-binding protein